MVKILGTALRGSRVRNSADHNLASLRGAPAFNRGGLNSIFANLNSNAYETAYPSINAIAKEFMQVRPFAIDGNGKKVEDVPALNALYHPNQKDSSVMFSQKLAVSTLVHRKTYLLVWRREGRDIFPGGRITPQNIAGYTFLEFPTITRRDGKTFYAVGSQEFTDDEVITVPGGVDPDNLYAGYSPNEASRRWAKLDDYIADFQAGFFENGAIPAGQFVVTAATDDDYNDTVDMLEKKHKGAGKNGNVSYSHRPINQNTGKLAEAQIEWIPFSQSNKDIDFKNLFEQVNKRIDTAFGVPQIVKGVDDAATYANAQVAEKGFAKRAVYPLLLVNYTQITHELNRITNGLGVAITFKYELPKVSDEEKVDAEATKIQTETIILLLDKGYSLNSIVDSLEFSNAFKNLKTAEEEAKIINDKPDVDEGGEVRESPDPDKIDGIKPLNAYELKCEDCGRYLGNTTQPLSATIKCSNSKCKHDTTFTVTTDDLKPVAVE